MRKIRDVLRLSANGLSKRKIAVSLGLSATAAGDCIRRAREAGVAWPLAAELTDAGLERLLYRSAAPVEKRRPEPDWAMVHRELKRAGVTLQLLWEEYRAAHPDGHGYSRFCQRYQEWKLRLSPTMRQTHVAGERLFVDYAGKTPEVIDGTTGEVRPAQLFVAVAGASSYTYGEARSAPRTRTHEGHQRPGQQSCKTPTHGRSFHVFLSPAQRQRTMES
jgi:transposase